MLEDTLFDDLNITQILINNAEPDCNKTKEKLLSSKSNSDNFLQTKGIDAFQQYVNGPIEKKPKVKFNCDESLRQMKANETSKRPLLTQFTQLFENSQIMNQIETILSEENSCSASAVLSDKNSGDVLNESKRDELESFFDQIEQSVSLMGTDPEFEDKDIKKILEALFGTQTGQDSAEPTNDFVLSETTISGINSSFASALKQVLLSNISKEPVPAKTRNVSTLETSTTFTEVGPFYGLPLKVKELIKAYKGIDELYGNL